MYLGSKVDGDKTGAWDSIVTIIYETFKCYKGVKSKAKCKVLYLTSDDFLTLNKCLEIIGYKHGKRTKKTGVVTVIIDYATEGMIYKYGNYNDIGWYLYGSTCGYC
jgi:hypothetical protein